MSDIFGRKPALIFAYSIFGIGCTYCGVARNLEELEERLRPEGIGMRYRLDESGRRMGVSFLYQNEAFRGSEIDRSLSLGGLEKTLGHRQELMQWEQQKLAIGKQIQQQEERVAKEQFELKKQEILKQQEVLTQQKALRQQELQKQKESQQQEAALEEKQQLRQRPRLRIH